MKKNPKHSLIYYAAGLIWIAALVFMDQRLKGQMTASLQGNGSVGLIPGLLRLTYVENRGMAFGMLQNGRIVFIVVTALVLCLLFLLFYAIPEKKRFYPLTAGVILIIAGAIGNFIDRIRMGYVVDYLDLEFMEFPVFNLADCFVTWTAVVMAILLIFAYKEEDLKQIRL